MNSVILCSATAAVGLLALASVVRRIISECREAESKPRGLILFGTVSAAVMVLLLSTLFAGSKWEDEQPVNLPAQWWQAADGDSVSGSQTLAPGPNLTEDQYEAGFALVGVSTNASPWPDVPSNAGQHEPWTRFGLADDTFWLPADGWSFTLGTNAADGVQVSSDGTLSFRRPKGSPRAVEMPDVYGISFLAPLQGPLGTVPPEGRFWHAPTSSNSVLFTWQRVFAGRETNSPVTFQAELFANGDFVYRYAFTNALALTNFVVGAQHCNGGETYALNDTNKLVNGLELRWRAFGILDPNVADHDGDGLSTYDEVMTYATSPSMPDTDLDGLGDLAEVVSLTDPLARDTDGDGLPDGSDPHPTTADSSADSDGDGLPDVWETYWFGSTNVTGSADADTNGDGFSDRVNLLTGTDPARAPSSGFAVTNAAATAGLDAWEIAPAFALEMQAGMTGVLSRTIQAGRASPWQQFFISSSPRAAGAWAPDGLELSWEGTNVSGSAAASPSGDSLRLALGTNLVEALTFRIAATRTSGLLRSPKPLYLVRWTPQPAFTPGPAVACVTSTNGVPHVAASLEYGGADALPFTADAGARPQKAAAGEQEAAELSLPPDPESAAYPVFTSGTGAGYLTAQEPSQASLPSCGTNAAVRVLLYKLEVVVGGGIEAGKPFGRFGAPYPLSSAGLRSQWRNNAAATDSLDPRGITVTTGLDSEALRVKINGEEAAAFTWTDEEDTGPAALQPAAMSALDDQPCECAGGALIELSLCGSNIVGRCEEEEPSGYDTETAGGGDDEGCECGDLDGGRAGSLKFRISLGSGGRDRISGFLWFAMETPQAVTPALFNVLGDPNVTVTTNVNGVISVACPEDNGRTVTVETADDGVLLTVRDANDALEHTWTITNPDGSVSLVKRDQADNPVIDETYAYSEQNGQWVRTDNLGGAAETLTLSGDLETEGQQCETRSISAGGVKASETVSYSSVIGSGESAVARVTQTYTYAWNGYCNDWLGSSSVYWTDHQDAKRNGLLRLRHGETAAWEYHDYDARGRETLAAGPLDGSAHHQDMETGVGIGTVAELAALQGMECAATEFGYAVDAEAGDTGDAEDSRKPRSAVSYVVRNGGASAVSREWRVYTRGVSNGVPTLAVRTVRAASATAAYGDAANAVTLAVSYAGPEKAGVPTALWNLPLREEREDGSVTSWAYELGGYDPSSGTFTPGAGTDYLRATSRTGTAQQPDGADGLSEYAVEIRDSAFGLTLKRDIRLRAAGAGDPVLSWEKTSYDVKGHMLVATYSDGTSETNVWDCCRLQANIGRDGRRTEYWSVPGIPGWKATAETSLGALPGPLGRYPVTEIFTDALGRETNRVRSVWFSGSRDSGYTPIFTETAFPHGTADFRIATDVFHVDSLSTDMYGGNYRIGETVSAGVTNRTVSYWGGATVEEKYWTDPVSGLCRTLATRTARDWDASGRETETVSVSRDGGAWTTESVTAKDFLGREAASARPGSGGAMLVTSNAYDNAGRKVMTTGHDGSSTAYAYDGLGNMAGSVRIGAGQTLDFDPLDFTLASVAALDKYVVTETPAWKEYGDLGLASNGVQQARWDCGATVRHDPGQGAVTASVQRVQLTGLSAACVKRTVSTDANGVTVIVTEAVDAAHAKTTVTSVNTAVGTVDTAESVAGVRTAGTNSLGGATSYEFDGFARQVAVTETAGSRTLRRATGYRDDGTAAFTADICGSVSNVTTHSERQYLQEPEGAYTVTTTDALGNETVSHYHPGAGASPYRTTGAAYPAETALDADGNRTELRTWRDEAGAPDITRWRYDAAGLVTNKVYADGRGPSYAYTADGKPASRTWARGVTTAYAYTDTATGTVQTVNYSGATPDVTRRHDLAGMPVSVDDGSGGRTFGYDAKGRPAAETNSLAVISRTYDSLGRDAGYDLDIPGYSTNRFSVRYGCDGSGRQALVTSSCGGVTNAFCYLHVEGTSLVSGMTNGAGFGWSRSYEPDRNLITAVSNFWNASSLSSFEYWNDALGRRTLRVDASPSLSATNTFAYNRRSEVTNAIMDAVTYAYSYDGIGNRQTSSVGVVASTYTANSLNQYTAIAGGLSRSPNYDLDGNMTWDGKFSYTWDGENRMTRSEPGGFATNGTLLVENGYDYQNRRFKKALKQLSGRGAGYPFDPSQPGTWDTVETRHFVWDGWNIAAEITVDELAGTTNVTRYVWGLDLSGSVQGAGGVGGLLAVIMGDGSAYYPCYDANGNITDYVDSNGTLVAHREYDPFGRTTVATWPLVHDLHFWFSTKYLDEETGNYVYQQRQYIPPLGRWASRDPVGEDGSHLYCWLRNSPIGFIDPLGLSVWQWNDIDLGLHGAEKKDNGDLRTGLTEITKWYYSNLRSSSYKNDCCILEVFAEAEVKYWWANLPPSGKNNLTPKQHEENHVRLTYLQWKELKSSVDPFVDSLISCKKLKCYKELVKLLFEAHRHVANAINYGYDVNNGDDSVIYKRDEEHRLAKEAFQKIAANRQQCLSPR